MRSLIPDAVSSPQAAASPASGQTKWLWMAILPLAAILRLLFLSRESLWLDEAASVGIVRQSWHDFVRVLWQGEANMTTFYLALRPVVLHVGDSEFWVRLPAVVAGLATIPVIFRLGETMFDRRTGLLATLLLAVNGCHVAYSREARGYSMAVLFAALSVLLFLRTVENGSRRVWWILYAVAGALAVYSHFYAGLVIVAEWFSLLARPRHTIPWKRLIAANVTIAVLISPLAAVVMKHNVGQLSWVQSLSWLEIYHTAVFFAADEGKVLGNILLFFCLIALGNAMRKTIAEWDLVSASADRWRRALALCWLIAPPLLTALLSLHTPLFFHRFFIVCLPAFVLLVAWGIVNLPRSTAVVAVFTILSVATVAQHYRRTRENWRSATEFVLSHAQSGDAAFFWHRYGLGPFSYYQARHSAVTLPEVTSPELASTAYRRLWVVLYPVSPSDPSVEGTAARLVNRYPVVQDAKFRRVRVVLLDLGRP